MKKILLLVLVLTLAITALTGCSKKEEVGGFENTPDIEDIPSIEDIPADEAAVVVSEEETPFVMVQEDGSQVYLDEESPNVIKLQMAVAKYGELSENIDFNMVTGKEYFEVMTEEAKNRYTNEGIEQLAIDHYGKYKIIKHFEGIKYNSVKFQEDTAVVDIDVAFVYEEVENLADYETGVTYYAPQTLEFKIVDGEWLLSGELDHGQIYEIIDED
jgi:hypothetical protein